MKIIPINTGKIQLTTLQKPLRDFEDSLTIIFPGVFI